ncbi:hypothetical protein HID58_013510 [Brassica napus]|uniref:Uncharacterized protein n=1 Tax=Brassica napus TaxID=3708 RepID=A0ABQ8E4N0_BRANA|nr:hypothetical protein HID58_013510 [Brassica napus]
MRTVEYIAKCKTVRHTTKSTRLELGNTAKCSIVEHTTKYTTVGHITDFSTVVHTVKCTIIGGTANYTKMGNTFECLTMGHTTKRLAVGDQQWGHQRPKPGNDKSAGTNPTNIQM